MNEIPEHNNYAVGTALPTPEIKYLPSQKRVRAFLGGQAVADSCRAVMERERPWIYYFPPEDVKMEFLEAEDGNEEAAELWTVRVGDAVAERAAWAFSDGSDEGPDLTGYIAFKWGEMEAWFEEDEEVSVHPRDPYVRIDLLHSSRPIRVVIAGETVAETERPVLLFETGLPVRFYIPKADVRQDLLVPSDTHTGCPYKGQASYYSIEVGSKLVEDAAWYYPFPYPEMAKIQNLIAFYPHKVDEFYVDDQPWPEGEGTE
jgi:uncharacterized protein (DUF427 family)